MIDKNLYDKIAAEWKKIGPIYQKWEKLEVRMPEIVPHFKHFAGLMVLEFGCNAGIYSIPILEYAKAYVGVDRDEGDYYIRQAEKTQSISKLNSVFFRMSVNDFIKTIICEVTFNALFTNYALYHFADREIEKIETVVLPKCEAVVICTRTKRKGPWKKYNSHHFEVPNNVVKWLYKNGFTTVTNSDSKTGKFSVITGVKDADKGRVQEDCGNLGNGKQDLPIVEENRREDAVVREEPVSVHDGEKGSGDRMQRRTVRVRNSKNSQVVHGDRAEL